MFALGFLLGSIIGSVLSAIFISMCAMVQDEVDEYDDDDYL